jgi:hypothetical protein
MEICALCGEEKELCVSHFIPKFVFNWTKRTSATGYLRPAANINKRVQDGVKEKLLCCDCEGKFSKYETYFADKIFHPYVNGEQSTFEYDENLQKFIISMAWRIVKKDLEGFKKFQPEMFEYTKKAEEYWRRILLEDKTDEKYEHHLLFLGYVEDSTEELPDKFQWYTIRAIDGTLASSKQEVYLFAKLPSMIFISSIFPESIEKYWENTIINKQGKIGEKLATSKHPGFSDFLFSRVREMNKNELSPRQNEKIKETMLKDLEKVRDSKSFEVWNEENNFRF